MNTKINESDFREVLRENITAQWHKFEYFRNICAKKNKRLQDLLKAIDNEEYYRIPAIVTTAFKKSKGLLRYLNDMSQEGMFQVSSSTSGDPSYVFTSRQELEKISRNYGLCFGIDGISRGIAFSPSRRILENLTKKDRYLNYKSISRMKIALDAANEMYSDMAFTLDIQLVRTLLSRALMGNPVLKRMLAEEINESIYSAEKEHMKISLGGIVLLFIPYLNQMKEGQFTIGENAFFSFSGGGYSGSKGALRGEKIDKLSMVDKIASVFGMNRQNVATNIKDIYAFTECSAVNEGYWCDEISDYLFEAWHESRIYIVDPETEQPKKIGTGLVKIITPYSNGSPSAANVSVLQLDSAVIREVMPNFIVTRFSHIQRSGIAGSEGCALKAEEISYS